MPLVYGSYWTNGCHNDDKAPEMGFTYHIGLIDELRDRGVEDWNVVLVIGRLKFA